MCLYPLHHVRPLLILEVRGGGRREGGRDNVEGGEGGGGEGGGK